ncbi:formate dehydrogenase accessory sulfurtransferase FdhD [Caenimonas koreensis DSM 17982]|uniref:Sulfur carrier protein FdhD n=1 Tax=Caenimonas koreensis DSM 17982 TaxID=1121255 RepID=A0A844B978_9BURK|nr:formate dehydrogenase accessory sulfurtransferase FdhD [Caenimonas koreensis]MRD48036.1 formate dehydrogenase accessory sulfurtransferase FdhD [Caenimonas koreensis DSM 17982]
MNLSDPPVNPPPAMRHVPMERRDAAGAQAAQDWVAMEVPVALEFNGISHAVMLASPADLEDFAYGFSLTEEIVDSAADIRDVEVVPGEQGITVRLEIASSCFARLKERRRSLAGRTGCGLCGTESLPDAVRTPPPLNSQASFSQAAVLQALQSLRSRQPLHDATGATHAAAFADTGGGLLIVREDVGRHNALDKLIGAMQRARHDANAGFIVVTSRASYEMAGKAARAGAPLLAAVSGVTGLAIDVAQQAGLCLIGFARGDNLNIYTHAERVRKGEPHGQ